MADYSLDDYDFESLARKEPNARARIRLLMMAHLKDGVSRRETAVRLKASYQTVSTFHNRFKIDGIQGLYDRPRSGRPYTLPPALHDEFKALISTMQEQRDGGRLIGEDIRQLLKDHYQCEYTLNGVYDLLKALGMSWITSRSRHPKQDIQAQEAFKKLHSSHS